MLYQSQAHATQPRTFGLPEHPSCLAFDAVQSIVAVGSMGGSILLYGNEISASVIQHPVDKPVTDLAFVTNRVSVYTSTTLTPYNGAHRVC